MLLQLTISFFLVLCGTTRSEGFSYEDPNKEWGEEYPTCNGDNQSPVDVSIDENYFKIEDEMVLWNNYDNEPDSMQIVNTGHTVQVNPVWSNEDDRPYLSGGPLKGEYVMEQFHFHWGSNDDEGSEHTLDKKRRSMELHMVHWKRDYGSLEEAAKNEDGVAVVATFYRALYKGKTSKGMNKVLDQMKEVQQVNSESKLKPFKLTDFGEVNGGHAYTVYFGSLTTPGCNEAVTWLLTSYPQEIDLWKFQELRKTELAHGDDHNNRPVQKLGDRKFKFYRSQKT